MNFSVCMENALTSYLNNEDLNGIYGPGKGVGLNNERFLIFAYHFFYQFFK